MASAYFQPEPFEVADIDKIGSAVLSETNWPRRDHVALVSRDKLLRAKPHLSKHHDPPIESLLLSATYLMKEGDVISVGAEPSDASILKARTVEATPAEQRQLTQARGMLGSDGPVALVTSGYTTNLPATVRRVMVAAIDVLAQTGSVTLQRIDRELPTGEFAEILGRPANVVHQMVERGFLQRPLRAANAMELRDLLG
jgi:hypothetical protein